MSVVFILVVSRAFQILSDPEKKSKYDSFGGDPDNRFGPGSTSNSSPFSGFARSPGSAQQGPMWDDEISPEEMFNRFFGGGMGGGFGPFGTWQLVPEHHHRQNKGADQQHGRWWHVRRRLAVRFQSGRRTRFPGSSIWGCASPSATSRGQCSQRRTSPDIILRSLQPPTLTTPLHPATSLISLLIRLDLLRPHLPL